MTTDPRTLVFDTFRHSPIGRIPAHDARDRAVLAAYLRDMATAVATGRVQVDPYGVVIVFVGPEGEDVGSRGIVYRHDYQRASRALRTVVSDAAARREESVP